MTAPLRQLLGESHRAGVIRLALLMLVAAMTEGFGLLLLVPMLATLDRDSASNRVALWFESAGLPLELGPLLAIFAFLVALRAIVNLARDLENHDFQTELVDGLRSKAWNALLHCDWRKLSAMRQSDNASLLLANIDRVGMGVNQLIGLLAMLTTLAAISLAAMAISHWVALSAAAGGALVLFVYRRLARRARSLGVDLGEAYRVVHGRLIEGLGALRLIKSFGREDAAADGVNEGFASLRQTVRKFGRGSGIARVALEAGGALVLALIVWLAIGRWGQGPSEILPLVALFARAVPLLSAVQGTWQNWSHARPAVDELFSLIAELEAAREPACDLADAPRLTRAMAFESVTVHFAARKQPALDSVSLTILAQGITAILGPSGAGKSTLADLAGGLLGPDRGRISIDGIELDSARRRAWRSRVAYVQQEPVLFTGTIRENLLWAAPDASMESLLAALSDASAEFVEMLPEGLDSRVGEGGRQLSGGERQRIVLARALLRQPDLLILDEATSALDAENEAAIADAVSRLGKRMSVLIVCHRGALQKLADSTITLNQGQVASVSNRQ